MKGFADMIIAVGKTNSMIEKQSLLSQYFSFAEDKDKLWAIALFSGKKPKKKIKAADLKAWCIEYCEMPIWLFEASYQHVGDLAETISLLLPPHDERKEINTSLHEIMVALYSELTDDEISKKELVLKLWKQLDKNASFVFNKLITGGFRVGISQQTLIHAIAKAEQMPAEEVAYNITGNIDPMFDNYGDIILNTSKLNHSKPYPFFLTYPLESGLSTLGTAQEWIAEWKWDGIRGQCIKRDNQYFIWSRGETLITSSLPEFETFLQKLPDGTVLDGEILCGIYNSEKIQALPFSLLQTRINRKKISAKIMRDAPVIFVAYDILEHSGEDIRQCSLNERKSILNQLIQDTDSALLISSPDIPFTEWHELTIARNQSRQNYAEGLMLKKKDSPYLSGRKKGFWWKWKTDPLSIDCVLIYAQKGHGRRSGLYTDYTFAVKYGTQLVSITKAYSGLTDKEIKEVDDYIKKNGIEKFGPVKTVKPELVFEIIFEGIAESSRHKSGIALRFPRIKRLRKDKTADEINTLDDLKQMLRQYNEHHVKNV